LALVTLSRSLAAAMRGEQAGVIPLELVTG
jgi:hypothetical protein